MVGNDKPRYLFGRMFLGHDGLICHGLAVKMFEIIAVLATNNSSFVSSEFKNRQNTSEFPYRFETPVTLDYNPT
jgi:hypothetical protein